MYDYGRRRIRIENFLFHDDDVFTFDSSLPLLSWNLEFESRIMADADIVIIQRFRLRITRQSLLLHVAFLATPFKRFE